MSVNQRQRPILLVEPAAGVGHGHFMEKLVLWCDGLVALGFAPTVICWDAPKLPVAGATFAPVTQSWVRALARIVPRKRLAMWVELWTYLKAFRLARKLGWPVLGLTTSGPIPVAVAAKMARPQAGWGQIVMYGGLYRTAGGVSVRPRALAAFQSLFQNGCRLLANAPLTTEVLGKQLVPTPTAGCLHLLNDPIYVSTAFTLPCVGKRPSAVTVLVPGHEDHRRTPLGHLTQANLQTAIEELVVHQAGRNNLELAGGTAWTPPSFIRQARVITDYLTGDALAGVFARAKFCLIAYDPKFLSGSANLALSVACGTPALCSGFPYADSLFRDFGKIGEQFVYGDHADFARAWERLNSWSASDWAEFEEARRRLIARVTHREVARQAADFLGLNRVRP